MCVERSLGVRNIVREVRYSRSPMGLGFFMPRGGDKIACIYVRVCVRNQTTYCTNFFIIRACVVYSVEFMN